MAASYAPGPGVSAVCMVGMPSSVRLAMEKPHYVARKFQLTIFFNSTWKLRSSCQEGCLDILNLIARHCPRGKNPGSYCGSFRQLYFGLAIPLYHKAHCCIGELYYVHATSIPFVLALSCI